MKAQHCLSLVLSVFVLTATQYCLAGAGGGQATGPETASPQSSKRILYVVPAYDVVPASTAYRPLTAADKLSLFARETFDPFTAVKAAADAGLGQALDRPHYGQGGESYGKRLGAALADSASADFFSNFAFPALLRQDPRYFQSASGHNSHRFRYALSRVVVTRNDSGQHSFNFSQVLGTLSAAALSNAYYPNRDRTVGYTLGRFGERLAVQAGVNVLKEFWPELRRKLGH